MGQTASVSNGSICVALQKGQYTAGNTITGYVQVSVNSQMACGELYAILFGETRTKVHYTTTRTIREGDTTRTVTEHHTAHDRRRLVEDRRTIAIFPGGFVNPGLYQFPFQFALHPSLPSSVDVWKGSDHAKNFYGVEVLLNRPGIFHRDLVHATYFDLIANVPHPIVPQWTSDVQRVNCCCCFPRGEIELGAALEKNAFRACEAVNVRCQIYNNASVEVQRIVVCLRERTQFRAHGHHTTAYLCLAQQSLPGVPPGGGFGDRLGTPPTVVSLFLPAVFPHCSLRTPLLQVEHYVEVRADTPFGVNNPSVILPVTLHRSGETMAFAPMDPHPEDIIHVEAPVAYNPVATAMASPGAIPEQPLVAVMPNAEQALLGADIDQNAQSAREPFLKGT